LTFLFLSRPKFLDTAQFGKSDMDQRESRSANSPQGTFFTVPVRIGEVGGKADGMIMLPSPWGVPLGMGLYGTTGDQAEQTLWISLDQEITWLHTAIPLEKRAIEKIHVQRFAADCRRATGRDPYNSIETSTVDPPDFLVRGGEGKVKGLECAAFSIEERRGAQALFNNFKSKLVIQPRNRTGHLSGSSILTWFGRGQNPDSRPPKKNDDAAAKELISALVQYRPDMDTLRRAFSIGMHPQMPPLATNQTPRDASFYSVPLLGAMPTGPFTSATGYDIALSYTTTHTASTVSAVIRKLVSDHDQEGVDKFLITSGGPDRLGSIHPAEQILSDFYLKNSASLKTKYIRSVIFHRWPTGDAYELLGDQPKKLWPAIYRDYLPAHQVLAN
jgi:hypothetical protein